MEDTEAETGPPLYDSLVDTFDDFDGYDHIAMMDEDDLDDLEAIRLIFSQNKKKRGLKFRYRRCNWESHIQMLTATNGFENRFRMPKDNFNYLLEAIRECITVDFLRSMNSTGGNDPIYPEMVMAMGLRFLGLGSAILTLWLLESMVLEPLVSWKPQTLLLRILTQH